MTKHISSYLLQAVFYLLIPITAIFFRYKKKITTGFALGVSFSSFALGLLSVATVVRADPLAEFMREINHKNMNYEEAKRKYKIIVQGGPNHLEKIKTEDIIDPSVFQKIKEDTASDYKKTAGDIYKSCALKDVTEDQLRENTAKLKHALKLLEMSESIGIPQNELKNKIEEKLADSPPPAKS
ncbi:MAG: hypothetical protein LBT84_01510 [Spirochaetia bacterium]|jgi:hypothetical protein|nr:hypothetical protein [Spirochaetia bacterium]